MHQLLADYLVSLS